MIKLFKYLNRRDWCFAAISLAFIVAQVWLDLKLPDYMSEITTLVQTQGSAMGDILIAGGYMLLCALGSLAATVIVGYFVAKIAAGLAMRLREAVYDKTMSFSMEEIGHFSTASLITRSTNDITQIQTFVALGLQALVKSPILAVWAIVKISGKNWQWSLTTGVAVFVLLVVILTTVSITLPKFTKIQRLTDDLNRVARENLTGIRVVRAYNAEQYQEDKFEAANDTLTRTNVFANRATSMLRPAMRLLMSGLTLAIYWIGAYLINGAVMGNKLGIFSDMVVYSSYAMQILMAFMMLTMTFIILPRASVAAKRIKEVLDTESKIQDGTGKPVNANCVGEVEFQNVSFKYPDAAEYVLHDVSFKANKGETVAFIGSTGSGKSTLINLVPRFYDATEGQVLIDGVDVRDYKQEALRDKLGYVPQRAVLFSGTVRSNVGYGENGKTITTDDVTDAVYIAQASEFVEAMEGGYDARIAQGGSNVSGGQKQRLSIARAVCRHPEIYVFDDSFSALDYRTDRVLRTALKKETAGVTSLIVAQRIGTIMDADRIIVLDEGRVVGNGTHKELLNSCAVYREIAESQLTKEEIDHA